ncbi:MAG: hypothetical protein JWL83_4873 [Actinomycetia bacterium]|nr:hypothetical protein [Actinomycetes bacterium]
MCGQVPQKKTGGSVTGVQRSGRTSRSRSATMGVALVTVLALALAACGGSSSKGGTGKKGGTTGTTLVKGLDPNAGTPTPGGSATFALEAETTGGWCLPEAQLAMAGIQVARSIYDTLTVPDSKGNYIPFLAKTVTPNADFTKWTITLRDGIKFHDGTPLTAQVVKDNLDAYRGKFPARKPLLFVFVFDNLKDVKVTGPLSVEVDTIKPWVSFPAHLYSYGRLGMMAEKQLKDGGNCFKDMIGTGPFEFKGDWVVNDHLTVVKNPTYWRKDKAGAQLPYLDKITYKPIVETATLVNGMQAKQFDIAETDTTDAIFQLRQIAQDGSITMVESAQYPEITYNMFNSSKPPFDNINARKAFSYAINADEYNQVRQHGILKQAFGPFGNGTLGYLPESGYPAGSIIKYDPAKAKTLVATYKQQAGQAFAFTYTTGTDPFALQSAQLIQNYMKAVGITMNIKQEEQSTMINDAISGNFQVTAWRNHPGFDPDTQWVWWHCGAVPAAASPTETNIGEPGPPQNGNNCNNAVNFGRFNDAQINKNFETGRSNPDPAVRKTAYEDLNKSFAKQVWNAWGFYALWTLPSQSNVKGQLGPNLPTATSPDAVGNAPFTGLSSGDDTSGLWIKH